jgi:hypothetical protein
LRASARPSLGLGHRRAGPEALRDPLVVLHSGPRSLRRRRPSQYAELPKPGRGGHGPRGGSRGEEGGEGGKRRSTACSANRVVNRTRRNRLRGERRDGASGTCSDSQDDRYGLAGVEVGPKAVADHLSAMLSSASREGTCQATCFHRNLGAAQLPDSNVRSSVQGSQSREPKRRARPDSGRRSWTPRFV